MSTTELLIEVSDLCKRFAARAGVSGVTIRLAAGEILGLVGANGGGKTTTLRMLAGLLCPDDGSGHVLGRHLARDKPDYGAMGYMAQRLVLYPELTVEENLRFRCNAFRLPEPAARLRAVAERYGLVEVLRHRAGTLSGGWSRRVQFAVTVLHRPRLLLLDEPTAGLDPVTRRDLWQWLAALAGEGCGIVLGTHDLAEAERIPRILHFRDNAAEGPFSPASFAARAGASSLEAAVIAAAHGP